MCEKNDFDMGVTKKEIHTSSIFGLLLPPFGGNRVRIPTYFSMMRISIASF